MNNIYVLSFLPKLMRWHESSTSTAERQQPLRQQRQIICCLVMPCFFFPSSLASKCVLGNCEFCCLQHATSHDLHGKFSSCHTLASPSCHSFFHFDHFPTARAKLLEFMRIFFAHKVYTKCWQIYPINLTNALSWPPLKDAAIVTAQRRHQRRQRWN